MITTFERPLSSPDLIGRAAELDHLRILITRAKDNPRKVILISGEAGIGKSRLVAAAKAYSLANGFLVQQGSCFQQDVNVPYGPILDLLRTAFATQAAQPEASATGALLAQLLPDVMPSQPQNAVPVLEPQQHKHQLFSAIMQVLHALATRQPLLLILEDVHWSDETSLEFLLYLVRRSPALPIVLLATYRSDEVRPSLGHWLAQLDREHLAHELALARLTRQDVAQLVQSIFALDQAVHADFLDALYRLTEGNPFFIEEVLKSLLSSAAITQVDDLWQQFPISQLRIPRTVRDAVQQRLAQLSEGARQVVTWAAVAGRRFDFVLLQHLLACDEVQLLDWIKALINAQLVVEESADHFIFRHALTRQAIYTGLLARERKALHLAIGRAGEQVYASRLEAYVGDLAYHFYEAEAWAEALSYAQRAGGRALALYTPQAAIEHFTHALEAAVRLDNAPPVIGELYYGRGQAYAILGNAEAARADYTIALECASRANDQKKMWDSLIALGFLWSGLDYAQAGDYYQQALAIARRLDDAQLHAHSLNRLANWLVNVGRIREGLDTHNEALAIFEAHQDRQGMAETLDLLGMAHGIHDDVPAAVRHLNRAIQLFRETGDNLGLASSLVARGVYNGPAWNETAYRAISDVDDAIRDLDEALRLARQIGALPIQAFGEWTASIAHSAAGNLGAGLIHAQQALQIANDIGHQQWLAAAHYAFGQLYVRLLAPELAIPALESGLSVAKQLGSSWWIGNITAYLAFAYLLKGDTDRAKAALDAALPRHHIPGSLPERHMAWAGGNWALACQQPQLALQIADQLLASVPNIDDSQSIPWLLKLKGDALARQGQYDEALLLLEQARYAAQERGAYPLLWQLQVARGRVLRKLNAPAEARAALAAARDVIARLVGSIHDPTLAEPFVRAARAQLSGEDRRSEQTNPARYGGLTRREQDIVAEIARNKTNREIADALGIGERTVETHVSNILAKLGLASRREIAAWAADTDLFA